MKLTEDEFFDAFSRLCYTKQKEVDEIICGTYWQALCHCEYLKETFLRAIEKTFYADFQKSITRFPEVSELLQLNKEIAYEAEQRDTKWLSLGESRLSKDQHRELAMKFGLQKFSNRARLKEGREAFLGR